MSATGQVPARGRRHPMTVVTEARRLHNEGGWNPTEIVDLLARQGITVGRDAVMRWTDPRVAEAARLRSEERNRMHSASKSGRIGHPSSSPAFKLARMRALREDAGLGYNAIAKVMRFDFGDDLSRGQVEYALETGRYPRERSA